MKYTHLKSAAIDLRLKGKTYPEIREILKVNIPKSTLSTWCKGIELPKEYINKFKLIELDNLKKARIFSLASKEKIQKDRFNKIRDDNKHLLNLKYNNDTAKIILAILYLCEGTKSKKNASITLGNSDPLIINLFLQLLRFCYNIDESKFRCTVQCRHDQNINRLESYWSDITKIPRKQFYEARIDPRSIGKKSLKPDYKGVCRINYFSSDIFWNLTIIGEIICSN
jgi:hypothetical protein